MDDGGGIGPDVAGARNAVGGSEMSAGAGYLRRWDAAKTVRSQRDQQRRASGSSRTARLAGLADGAEAESR
jgi:hypothetical protein